METDMQHQQRQQQKQQKAQNVSSPLRNHKNRMPATAAAAAALNTSSDSMSYLGPFNFRKLLRPVGPIQGQILPQQRRKNTLITVKNGAV